VKFRLHSSNSQGLPAFVPTLKVLVKKKQV